MGKIQGKALTAAVIILLLAAILFAVTNPRQEDHMSAITHRLEGKDAITNVINRGLLALKPPAYHTLTFFSYTKWNNRVSSIGVLGYVWVDITAYK